MLPREKRLARGDFENIQKKNRVHSEYITLITSPSETPKTAVIISKKTLHKAVDRNRLKRRLFDIIDSEHQPGGYYLFYAKRGLDKLSPDELRAEVQSLLKKALSS